MSNFILGIGGSNHDFSACILKDGEILIAIEDERIQRIKKGNSHWSAKPGFDSVNYCLDALNITLDEVEKIFCVDDLEMPVPLFPDREVIYLNHHLSHASSVYFSSNFNDAAVIVIDGHGSVLQTKEKYFEVETFSYGLANKNNIEMETFQFGIQSMSSSSWRYVCSNTLGWFYRSISNALGFHGASEGKMMGMASFGSPVYEKNLLEFVELDLEGKFYFDPYGGIWDWIHQTIEETGDSFRVKADIAASAQKIFEDVLLTFVSYVRKKTTSKNLCYAGGCALNSVANARLAKESGFENIFWFPAPGDNGLSIGAALYGYHSILGNEKKTKSPGWKSKNVYLGKIYKEKELLSALQKYPIDYRQSNSLVEDIVDFLAEESVIALWQQRSELGPRALGHRSLIAAPFDNKMRDHINLNIKFRESFRPVAPLVPVERCEEYFELTYESPYMLTVANVKSAYKSQLSAVCHIDGTARVQTVSEVDSPFTHSLLTSFGKRMGIPILINTSLNGPDEPIVESPDDALKFFINSPIDILVLDKFIVRKFSPYNKKKPMGVLKGF